VNESPLTARVIFEIGPATITEPVVTTWLIVGLAGMGGYLLTRRLSLIPSRRQLMLESVVAGIDRQISEIMCTDGRPFLPLLGTLFLFLLVANWSGLVPGLHAPTASLETTAALAVTVFIAVHVYGVKVQGLRKYLKTFAEPSVLMVPFNLLTQLTRTFSLMIRLFGNVMSGEFVIALLLALAGLAVPVPIMALEILTGTVQAYIFTVLATVYVGAAIGSVEGG
jgi:F-type H+-transporting ATPase subunit a